MIRSLKKQITQHSMRLMMTAGCLAPAPVVANVSTPPDIYKLYADGSLEWVAASDTDVVYAARDFNKNGTVRKDAKHIQVGTKGFIDQNTDVEKHKLDSRDIYNTTLAFGSDIEKAKEVFMFFADNMDTEINIMVMSNQGENRSAFVSTLTKRHATLARLYDGYDTLEENYHSHPVDASSPYDVSGFDTRWMNDQPVLTPWPGSPRGDRNIATMFKEAIHGVYIPATNAAGEMPKMDTNMLIVYDENGAVSAKANVLKIP